MLRHFYILALCLIATQVLQAQVPAAPSGLVLIDATTPLQAAATSGGFAFFHENFETISAPNLPSGWTSSSNCTTGFYSGTAGNGAGQANENGFWPVPARSRFAMTNDDVYDCDKSADSLELPVLNFSQLTDMALSFAAFHNNTQSIASVSIKVGNSPWNTIYTLPVSQAWQHICIPLPGTDNSASVRIKFSFDDGGNYSSGLALDDITVDPLAGNDLELRTTYFNGASDSKGTTYYNYIPKRQAQEDALRFGATAFNGGSNDQSNVLFTIGVTGAGNYSNGATSAFIPSQGQADINLIAPFFTPSDSGNYQVTFNVGSSASDEVPTNNSSTFSFDVTDTVYARDNGNHTGAGLWLGTGYYQLGVLYEINALDTVNSISTWFHGSSIQNSAIEFHIYSDTNLTTPVISSGIQNITLGQIGQWSHFSIPATPLPPGNYITTMEVISGTVVLASDIAQPTADSTVFLNTGPWSTIGFTPFLRMNLQPFTDLCPDVVSSVIEHIACYGDTNGSIALSLNGTGPYTYAWSNGETADSISLLSAGNYTVTVSYGIGCSEMATYSILEPDSLVSQPIIADENCGSGEGSVTSNALGGTAPHTYTWAHGDTNAVARNLTIGTYYYTVTDSRGCLHNDSAVVNGTPAVDAVVTLSEPSCGTSLGVINVAPSSGPSPYSYAWSHNPGLLTGNATSLTPAAYAVTVSDSNNCSRVFSVLLNSQNAPVITTDSVTDAICFGEALGGIDVSVAGGTAPYTYLWSDDSAATDQDLVFAKGGIYFLTVTDDQSCVGIHTDTIDQADSMDIRLNPSFLSCFGDTGATIETQVSGGNPGYSYIWSNQDTTPNISDLVAGAYALTVTDTNNCKRIVSAVIAAPTAILIDTVSVTREDTLPGNQGAIDIGVTGGNPPYSYSWSNGASTEDLAGISGGPYTVTVTDGSGCSDTLFVFVGHPVGIHEQASSFGNVRVFPNPGSGIFQIEWESTQHQVEDFDIKVVDLTGRPVFTRRATSSDNLKSQIDLSEYSSGVYLLLLSNGQESNSHRLIIY